MEIKHHPDAATLMTCAAGSQPEVLCAVVSSHLSLCETCMNEVSRMEHIGVALLDALSPEALASNANCAITLKPEKEQATAARAASDPSIPAPLRAVLDVAFDKLDWKPLAPGISSYPLPMSMGAAGALQLLMLEPGGLLPASKHSGEALLMVLEGRCEAQNTELNKGDYLEFVDGHTPAFRADNETGCILLLAEEGLSS